jgi:hypothetical protein
VQSYVSHELGSDTNTYAQYGSGVDLQNFFASTIAQGIGVPSAISANPSCNDIKAAVGL